MGKVQRFGSVSRLKADRADYYGQLHAAPWKQINDMIKECNLQNYSIYFDGEYLFSYYEYEGDDCESDMEKMAADPETQQWGECIPCMNPLSGGGPWMDMKEIYHLD
ncbi:MAG: L-rhamnose mutarotase [Clostridium sp.]|nr:L-rhamnose mutarotase [Clostridium sp.]